MSYPGAPVFWLELTDQVDHSLRRFRYSSAGDPCTAGSYCDASVPIGLAPARYVDRDGRKFLDMLPDTPRDDPRWPTRCAHCGRPFTDDDEWQDFQRQVYVTADGTLCIPDDRQIPGTVPTALPGAMWDAWWMGSHSRGPDGICLAVLLPNRRTWLVDSRASNCTMPDDNVHKCWVRHGDPRTEPHLLTIDKDGVSCSAGAGSIQADDYHGFLHNGALTPG